LLGRGKKGPDGGGDGVSGDRELINLFKENLSIYHENFAQIICNISTNPNQWAITLEHSIVLSALFDQFPETLKASLIDIGVREITNNYSAPNLYDLKLKFEHCRESYFSLISNIEAEIDKYLKIKDVNRYASGLGLIQAEEVGEMSTNISTKTNPKAFIVYCWEEEDHQEWVEHFAYRLRGDGIDVELDQWGLNPGDNLTEFMEKSIAKSEFILLICTPKYKYKFENREGGVGYEGHMITASKLQGKNLKKIIPILKSGDKQTSVPSFLSQTCYIDLSGVSYSEDSYSGLVNYIHGLKPKIPPLGPITK